MATSGSVTQRYSTSFDATLLWERVSSDVVNNKSTIRVSFSIKSLHGTINYSIEKVGTLVINGTTYNIRYVPYVASGKTKTYFTKTIDIFHDTYGEFKNLSISWKGDFPLHADGDFPISVNLSMTNQVIDTIPRKATFTMNKTSGDLGTAFTIDVKANSTSFSHNIYYKFGNQTVNIATNVTNLTTKSYSFTPASSLGSQIPNSTSGTATIYVDTYLNGSLVGTNTQSLTFTIPSSAVPTISSLSATVVADGADTSYGYVQGKSKCKLTINGSAGVYGSTIKSYKITGNGSTFTASSGTTNNLSKSGTFTYTATVTDSRGRTSVAKTVSITVQAYSVPKITSFTATRCTSDGTANETGTYVKVTAQYSYTSLSNKNSISASVTCGGSTKTITNGGSVILGGSLSANSSYAVNLEVKDNFITIAKATGISPSYVTLELRNGGKGISFGRPCNVDKFIVDMDTAFYKGLVVRNDVYDMDVALDIIESTATTGIGVARIRIGGNGQGASKGGFLISKPGEEEVLFIDGNKIIHSYGILPRGFGTYDLGSSSWRWRTVYAVNALNTSDVRYKENIIPIQEYNMEGYSLKEPTEDEVTLMDMRDFIKNDCNLFKYNYKEQDHEEFGFIAQDIVNTKVGRKIIIGEEKNKEIYSYSIGSYIGVVVGALQEEIRVRDVETEVLFDTVIFLDEEIIGLQTEINNLKEESVSKDEKIISLQTEINEANKVIANLEKRLAKLEALIIKDEEPKDEEVTEEPKDEEVTEEPKDEGNGLNEEGGEE